MSTELEPSGERLIEEHYRNSLGGYVIYLMHSASYRLAERYCSGKRVLDLGCGSGYGVGRIARVASNVVGVDVSDDAVAYAKAHYSGHNVSFSVIAADMPLPFVSASFDVVLSFQVIEHVADDRAYLREAARLLSPDGLLILITPDRINRLLSWQKPWNRWHLREYSANELSALVGSEFKVCDLLRMSARSDVAEVELRRYRNLKWLTLPFTLPFLSERWRRRGLDWLHRLRTPSKPLESDFKLPNFGEEVIRFEERAAPSLNIVIIARPRVSA